MQKSSYIGPRVSNLSLLPWWSGVSRDTLKEIKWTKYNNTLVKLVLFLEKCD